MTDLNVEHLPLSAMRKSLTGHIKGLRWYISGLKSNKLLQSVFPPHFCFSRELQTEQAVFDSPLMADCTLSDTRPDLYPVSFWHIHSGKHSWKSCCYIWIELQKNSHIFTVGYNRRFVNGQLHRPHVCSSFSRTVGQCRSNVPSYSPEFQYGVSVFCWNSETRLRYSVLLRVEHGVSSVEQLYPWWVAADWESVVKWAEHPDTGCQFLGGMCTDTFCSLHPSTLQCFFSVVCCG